MTKGAFLKITDDDTARKRGAAATNHRDLEKRPQWLKIFLHQSPPYINRNP